MDPVLQLAAANRQRAQAIVGELQIEEIWRSAGAEPRLVGSLRMGLLVRHRDIDYHIYSPQLRLSESFAAMARLPENAASNSPTCSTRRTDAWNGTRGTKTTNGSCGKST